VHAILQELIYESLREGAVWPFDRHYIRPLHFHGQLELLIVRSGTATLRLGTRARRLHAGHLAWILPGVPHVMAEFSDDFDMWVVELEPALVASCWRAIDAGAADDAGVFSGWPLALGERLAGRDAIDVAGDELLQLAKLAARVWAAATPGEARPALRALGERALRVTLDALDPNRDASVAELASCLLLASPTVDRPGVAAELGVSEGFLSRKFQHELGVTFVEQRARARVAHFLALAGEARNLLASALDAGFGSYSQFHRIFTRVSGSRPRDYLGEGRRRSQLLVTGGGAQPSLTTTCALPDVARQRARLDA